MTLHEGAPLAPHDLWSAWELDPRVTLPLAASGALYALGVRGLWAHAGVGRGVTRRAVAAFALGWLSLAVALVSPLHRLGSALFSAHMTQHELLMVVAAPLLVLGRPGIAALWALPPRWRRPASAWTRASGLARAWRWASAPMQAWWAHAVALWAWHVPALYQATLRSDAVHAAQHAAFLGSAVLFWWALLRTRRAGLGAAVGYLFAAMVATGALGALLTFASTLWYPAYGRAPLAWGLAPLDDQRLGGLVMWVPGGLSYLFAALWLLAALLRDRPPARRRLGPAADATAGACVAVLLAPLLAGCAGSERAPAADTTRAAGRARATPRAALRVCADPNNLPFSNARGEGFENALVELVGAELGMPVEYTWWAQRRGFVRSTLGAGTCDVIAGIAASSELVLVTRPYYRSTYVFATRAGGPRLASLDDSRLRRLRVGVHLVGDDYANTPPAHALAARGITRNVRGYTLYGDYAQPDPPAALTDALVRGDVDVAIVWGPFAGWAVTRGARLELRPVTPEIDLPFLPFVYDVAMGVRRGDTTLRARLDGALLRRERDVAALLRRYGVPVVGSGAAPAAPVAAGR